MKKDLRPNVAPLMVSGLLAVLCAIAALNLPYGYYQFLRLAAFVGGIYLAWAAKERGASVFSITLVAVAILFNPILPIHFEKEQWRLIDLACAAVFSVAAWRLK